MNAQSLFEAVCFRPSAATTRTSKKPLLPRGNTDSVWMLSSIVSHCCSFLAKSFLFQLKLISKLFMVRFPKHLSTLMWAETTGHLLLVGPLAPSGGAVPCDSLPCSLAHSEEDVDVEMWQQWRACPPLQPPVPGVWEAIQDPVVWPLDRAWPLVKKTLRVNLYEKENSFS